MWTHRTGFGVRHSLGPIVPGCDASVSSYLGVMYRDEECRRGVLAGITLIGHGNCHRVSVLVC